jgi:tetratricopeptide (TPR) repeat protein
MRDTRSDHDGVDIPVLEAAGPPPVRQRPDTETDIGEADLPEARLRRMTALAAAGGVAAVLAVAAAAVIFVARGRSDDGARVAPATDVVKRIEALEKLAEGEPPLAALHAHFDRLGKRLDLIDKRIGDLEVLPIGPLEKPGVAAVKKAAPEVKKNGAPEPKKADPVEAKVTKVEPAPKTKTEETPAGAGPEAKLAAALGPGDPLEAVRDLPAALAAFGELETVARRGPLPAETCVLMARAAFGAARYFEAQLWAGRALGTLAPGKAAERMAAQKIEAVSAYRLGKHEVADAGAALALSADPRWTPGWSIRVRSLLALKKLPAAEAAAREAVKQTAGSAAANLDLAWVHVAQMVAGESALDDSAVAKAVEAARSALEACNNESNGREWPVASAMTLLAQGKSAEAVSRLRSAQRRESPLVHYLLGAALAGSDVDAATAALRRAAELARKGDNDDTREPLPVVPSNWPSDGRGQAARSAFRAGTILFAAGKFAPAEEQFRSAYLTQGDFVPAYEGACEALLKLGKAGDALDVITEAVELASKSPRAHLLRAAALVESANAKKRPADADAVFDALRRSVELDPAMKVEAKMIAALEPLLKQKKFAELIAE